MITLITGLPGAGKTLYALHYVRSQEQREKRQVYYHGIPGLNINTWIELNDPTEWHKCPPGSIILIDECRPVFPIRGNGAPVPEHVSKLETHRHQGLDLFLITQHPMLVDANLRRLTEKHLHIVRSFGMQRAVVHEFTQLRSDPEKNRSGSIPHHWSYPPEVFGWYKSAELHTYKPRIPKRLYYFIFAPIGIAAMAFILNSWINRYGQTHDTPAAPASVAPAPTSVSYDTVTPQDYYSSYQPRIPGLPHTAPRYDHLTQPTTYPKLSMCISSKTKCRCYSQQGTPLQVSDSICRQVATDGIFDDTLEVRHYHQEQAIVDPQTES